MTDSPHPQPATILKRLLALSYDLFILAALSMAYSALATLALVQVFHHDSSGDYQPMSDKPGFLLGWIATLVGFYWFFWKRGGQTVGMRAWRLKLVAIKGGAPGHGQILIRIALGPLSLLCLGLGYLYCLFNRDRLALHDIISGTRLISLAPAKRP